MVQPANAAYSTYYVDCSAGSAGSGTQANPWNSLASVNSRTFGPGDYVLFQAGTGCTGTLSPQGSGQSGAPAWLGRYGTGAKPRINGNGAAAAIQLTNQSFWTIDNLEVVNDAGSEGERSGVRIHTTGSGVYSGITIQNLDVHNVRGWTDRDANHNIFYLTAGIQTTSFNGSRFQDLLIQDNYVHDVMARGIGVWGDQVGVANLNTARHTGTMIQRNRVVNAATDGIVITMSTGGVVQNNFVTGSGTNAVNRRFIAAIWGWNSHDTTIQFNEASYTLPSGDSQGFDCDGSMTGYCLVQYNYSHHNAGGFFLDCQVCGSAPSPYVRQIVRYNLTANECNIASVSGGNADLDFYNNTIYCNGTLNYALTSRTTASNNIFYVTGGGSLPAVATYRANLYYGISAPANDPWPHFGDPIFALAGGSLPDNYKLQSGSPALGGAGALISNNGGRDYFGIALPSSNPTIGFHQGTGTPGGGGTSWTKLLKGVGSDRCLDMTNGTVGVQTTIYDCNGSSLNQQFTYNTDTKELRVRGVCLAANAGATGNGTAVITWSCDGTNSQKWDVLADGTIKGVGSGRCLDVANVATTNGSNVQLYDCYATSNQRWSQV